MPSVAADLIVTRAGQLLTIAGAASKKGREGGDLRIIEEGALASHMGRIVWVGSTRLLKESVKPTPRCNVVDADGRVVMPGFVDCHSHVLYAGGREEEYWMRTQGSTYQQIMAAGGGIQKTIRDTNQASEEELMSETIARLDHMLTHGTTTVEVKSGYSLSLNGEIRLLSLLSLISTRTPITIVPTLLGAHVIPSQYRYDREGFAKMVTEELIPKVVSLRLARFNDVFVEQGAFTPAEGEAILKSGKDSGLLPKVHADEFSHSGGAALAAKIGASSADHLVFANPKDAKQLAAAQVTAVLLPASSLTLKIGKHAKARKFIEAGVPLALGTDASPAVPCLSMQLVVSLSCALNGISLDEAVVAATINSAHSIGESKKVGSLEVGKKSDFLILEVENYKNLGYRFGGNIVGEVFKEGRLVASRGRALH